MESGEGGMQPRPVLSDPARDHATLIIDDHGGVSCRSWVPIPRHVASTLLYIYSTTSLFLLALPLSLLAVTRVLLPARSSHYHERARVISYGHACLRDALSAPRRRPALPPTPRPRAPPGPTTRSGTAAASGSAQRRPTRSRPRRRRRRRIAACGCGRGASGCRRSGSRARSPASGSAPSRARRWPRAPTTPPRSASRAPAPCLTSRTSRPRSLARPPSPRATSRPPPRAPPS